LLAAVVSPERLLSSSEISFAILLDVIISKLMYFSASSLFYSGSGNLNTTHVCLQYFAASALLPLPGLCITR
jgi:hypothetical protein